MNKNDIHIRLETPKDHMQVETLVREAFWNVYRPGCLEHYVLHRMRSEAVFVPELDLVLEQGGKIIGQTVFARAELRADRGEHVPILTMGPICIAPELQRQGYGKYLLDEALKRAAAFGAGAVCFEGNIDFYGHSGFTYASAFGIRYHGLPEGADASFFLCRELRTGFLRGFSGEYTTPECYFVDEAEAEEFDCRFPPKERLKTATQIF